MKRKHFSVEQIVAILKQAELGMPVADILRQVGILEQTFYRWKKQYAGLQSDQVRELKQLQLRSKLPRRRKMAVCRQARIKPAQSNQAWSMDFVADQLAKMALNSAH